MALATTNITTTIARNALGETINNVGGLCTSSKINEWSLHKPANYGIGKDAWTLDSNSVTGYVVPIGISSNTTGHRLGDFRGYDHTMLPPRYFNANPSISYHKYDDYNETIYCKKGGTSETYNGDGFAPQYYDPKYDTSGNSLLALQLLIDSVDHNSLVNIHENNIGMTVTDILAGTYDITARYYGRTSITEPWVMGGLIEGGTETLTITELDARFSIKTKSISPSTVTVLNTEAVSVDHTVTYNIGTTETTAVNKYLYWTFEKGGTVYESGQFQINITNETKTYTVNFTHLYAAAAEGTYVFNLRARSTSGEIITGLNVAASL